MATVPENGKAFHVTFRLSEDRNPKAYQTLRNLIRSHDSYEIKADGKHTIDYRSLFSQLLENSGDIDINRVSSDSLVTIGMLESLLEKQMKAQEEMIEKLLSEMGDELLDEMLKDLGNGTLTVEQVNEPEFRERYVQEALSDTQQKAKDRVKSYKDRYK